MHGRAGAVVAGTVAGRGASPWSRRSVWLWCSTSIGPDPAATPDAAMVDLLWQAFLRRFDIEHTFRLLKQTLGWTVPKLRDPAAADRWTWLIIAAHTQLRLARPIAADLRRPWEQPAPSQRLTPARVRRDFRHLRATSTCPANAPKPTRAGPGRPPGQPNRHPTRRYDVHTVTSNPNRKTETRKEEVDQPTTTPHRLKVKLRPRLIWG
nr:hypothetical protein GCM10020063_044990 [Dactylosporangium thailandense]